MTPDSNAPSDATAIAGRDSAAKSAPRRALSLFDAASIIVGIIIGAGIYETTPAVAVHAGSVVGLVAVWIAGGLLATIGALCYADLACAYPEDGGDYVYLKRAFGRRLAFVFAWCELWIVRPGAIGAMAFIFARYAHQLYPLGEGARAYGGYAAGSIALLTAVNMLGVRQGKWTQNVLTSAKVLGLAALFLVAWAGPGVADKAAEVGALAGRPAAPNVPATDYRVALILVLFTYGGWSEVAYVAAEVRDPTRNILKALLWGIGLVGGIYIAANLAFVHALGLDGLRSSHAVAFDVLTGRFGTAGGRAISALICLSTLGAINGQIFTGARIYYALGSDHPLFRRLATWNDRAGAPLWSLVVQAIATLVPVLVIALSQQEAAGADPAAACREAFERLVVFNAPVYWFFFLLVGLSLFVLTHRDRDKPRAFRVPLYPWVPLAFVAVSGWMLWSSCAYSYYQYSHQRTNDGVWSLAIMAAGVAVSLWGREAPSAGHASPPGNPAR